MSRYGVIYYSYLVFLALTIYLIVNTVSIMILFDISLKTRILQVDYMSRILDGYNIDNIETSMTCFGIKIHYYEYSNFLTVLMFINCISGFTFVVLLIIRRKLRKKIIKIKKFGFLLLSFLVILILILHHLPPIISRVGYYDILVGVYNRHLITLELIDENVYPYFFTVELKNVGSIANLILDIILYIVIGYVIFLSVWFSVYQNKKESKIVYIIQNKEELALFKNKKEKRK